eukprot:3830412-Heterocapsa_arctica.AAC.1
MVRGDPRSVATGDSEPDGQQPAVRSSKWRAGKKGGNLQKSRIAVRNQPSFEGKPDRLELREPSLPSPKQTRGRETTAGSV